MTQITLNQIISETKSFAHRIEGLGVTVYRSECDDLINVLKALGFEQHRYYDRQQGRYVATAQWVIGDKNVFVSRDGTEWTYVDVETDDIGTWRRREAPAIEISEEIKRRKAHQ